MKRKNIKSTLKSYRDKHRGGKYTKNHADVHKASKRHVKFAATNT